MSKINVKRPGTGLIKLEVQHQGTSDIRSNFRTSLLGTSGEKQRHIVEVREFVASISQSCLTASKKVLFRVFGRHVGVNVRAGGTFVDDNFYLGDRVFEGANSQNNVGVQHIPEDEFTFYVPVVHSVRDVVWKIQKKIARINTVLRANGWLQVLGNVAADVHGRLANSVGAVQNDPIIIPSVPTLLPQIAGNVYADENLIEFQFLNSGVAMFQGSAQFWNSFGIWCSPYFQELTGFPEFIMPTTIGGVTSFDEQLLAGQFRAGGNVPPALNLAANFRSRNEKSICIV